MTLPVKKSVEDRIEILNKLDDRNYYEQNMTDTAKSYYHINDQANSSQKDNNPNNSRHDDHNYRPYKRLRIQGGQYHSVEKSLYSWLNKARDDNIPITQNILKAKGFEFYTEQKKQGLPLPDTFKASNGWLRRFQDRFCIDLGSKRSYVYENCRNDNEFVQISDSSQDLQHNYQQAQQPQHKVIDLYESDSPDSETYELPSKFGQNNLDNSEENLYDGVHMDTPVKLQSNEKKIINFVDSQRRVHKKAIINGVINEIKHNVEERTFLLSFKENATLHDGSSMNSFASKHCTLLPKDFHQIFLENNSRNIEKMNRLLQSFFVKEQVIIEARMDSNLYFATDIKIV